MVVARVESLLGWCHKFRFLPNYWSTFLALVRPSVPWKIEPNLEHN